METLWLSMFMLINEYLNNSDRRLQIKLIHSDTPIMSSSLPRLKTVHQIEKRNNTSSSKDLKVKFHKVALQQNDDKGSRKKSVTIVRTQRFKTLERLSTLEDKRQYKNEKIHLNLIERKLLSGTYDEKKETSAQLTAIKQKRDQMKVQMNQKQKQIETLKSLIEEIRQDANVITKVKSEHDKKVNELTLKYEAQLIKAQNARQSKMILENMIKTRHETNLVLGKRCNILRQHAEQMTSMWNQVNIQQRESNQKCSNQESRLMEIIEQINKQRSERNEQFMKYQLKISRRKEGEIMHLEKSRQYVAQLDSIQHQEAMKEFHKIYDKILANMFIKKLFDLKMINLMARYSNLEKLYNEVNSYKTFDEEKPTEFVERFFMLEPERLKWDQSNRQKEEYLNSLQEMSTQLRKTLKLLQAEIDQNDSPSLIDQHKQKRIHQKQHIKQLKNECEDINEKSMRVKSAIAKMLSKMQQRGEKNILTGSQATLNNLILLTNALRQQFRNAN